MEDLFFTLMGKPEHELNEIIDTGAFNEIIRGYLVIALQDTGKQPADIAKALEALEAAFDQADAEEARLAFRAIADKVL